MRLVNRTRRSTSIPRRLVRERKLHLLPLYYLLRLSYLGAEGIENSGSFHFADHIYLGTPRGRFGIGKLIDAVLLSLPSCRSFRNRFIHSRDQVLRRLLDGERPALRVLSVPSGIPRDLIEAACALRQERPSAFQAAKFYCLDIDPAVLSETEAVLHLHKLSNFELIRADAFDENLYPTGLDLITSTGFGEFLPDPDLVRFYNICFRRLRAGGVLITSNTVRHRVSDYLLRNIAELFTYYREEDALRALFGETPFHSVKLHRDSVGYQVLVRAEKVL